LNDGIGADILSVAPPTYRSALNREFFSDTCWTLSMYLEAVAMIPQIYMFQRQASDEGGTVEVSTLVTVSLVTVSLVIFVLVLRLSLCAGGQRVTAR
jgi:hypothetical protein